MKQHSQTVLSLPSAERHDGRQNLSAFYVHFSRFQAVLKESAEFGGQKLWHLIFIKNMP